MRKMRKAFSNACLMLILFAASLSPIQQVRAYCKGHAVTIRRQNGVVWIEAEGLDMFGVGPTVEAAAKSFLIMADVMDHETKRPVPHRIQ